MTLMVAYSHSAEGAAALEQGRSIAARLQVDVVVFDLDEQTRTADRRLDAPSGPGAEGEVWYAAAATAPNAVEDLLDTALELDVTSIVVGIRRRSPVGKLIMGSQAQRIILGAAVPVVAVKTRAAQS